MSHRIGNRPAPIIDQIWQHNKTGKTYVIKGTVYNAVTDRLDVLYSDHLQQSDFTNYSRQLTGHAKAFLSVNEDGSKRFVLIAHDAEDYVRRHISDRVAEDSNV